LPVPTGEYVLPEGMILIVAEDGIVGEVKEAEVEEEDMDKEGLKEEQINALIDGLAEIISNIRKEVKSDIEAAEAKIREEFKQPGDDHKPPKPEQDTKTAIVQGLGKFVREAKESK